MCVYSRVYLVILIFVICIDEINVYALPVWRLLKGIYIYKLTKKIRNEFVDAKRFSMC